MIIIVDYIPGLITHMNNNLPLILHDCPWQLFLFSVLSEKEIFFSWVPFVHLLKSYLGNLAIELCLILRSLVLIKSNTLCIHFDLKVKLKPCHG